MNRLKASQILESLGVDMNWYWGLKSTQRASINYRLKKGYQKGSSSWNPIRLRMVGGGWQSLRELIGER